MCHALQRCSQRMMDRVKVRTGDTGAHPFISVTRLIPLSSRPLRHSSSRQTPPLNRHPRSMRQSPLFPFSACLLSSARAISFFLPFLLLLHFVWLNRGGEKKKKKDGKWVYAFLGLCCDGIVCPVTPALEDAPAFLRKTRMAWRIMQSKFLFKSPRSPPPAPLPSWCYCWRCWSKDWRITFCFPQNSNHQQQRVYSFIEFIKEIWKLDLMQIKKGFLLATLHLL